MIVYGEKSTNSIKKTTNYIDTCRIAPTIMNLFGLEKTTYMRDKI